MIMEAAHRGGGRHDTTTEVVMAVMRFDPFRDFDRLAEQVLGSGVGTTRAPRFMPMDVFREGDHFVLLVDLPGVDPESIDVHVDNGMLTIRAERSGPDGDGLDWILSERSTGAYLRQLTLGDGVDTDRIEAGYEAGVLRVTVPVAEKAKPRRIQVSAGGGSAAIETTATEGPTEQG
jgi:HSP20 family protein